MKVSAVIIVLLALIFHTPAFAGKRTVVRWAKPCSDKPQFDKPVFETNRVSKVEFEKIRFDPMKFESPRFDRVTRRVSYEIPRFDRPKIETPLFDGKCPASDRTARMAAKRTTTNRTVFLVQQKPAPCPCTAENRAPTKTALPN